MTTAFKIVQLNDAGDQTQSLLKAITANNTGLSKIDYLDLLSWLTVQKCIFPFSYCTLTLERNEGDESLIDFKNEGKLLIQLQECEIHELKEEENNLSVG